MNGSADGFTVERLDEKHRSILLGFDCGHPDISEFAHKDIFEYQKQHLGVSYVLSSPEGKVLSFITLAMGSIRLPPPMRFEKIKGITEVPNQLPALKIGRIGTLKTEQKKGHAKRLINYAIYLAVELRERIGCYYLTLDAYPGNVKLYEKCGFSALATKLDGRETVPMAMKLP